MMGIALSPSGISKQDRRKTMTKFYKISQKSVVSTTDPAESTIKLLISPTSDEIRFAMDTYDIDEHSLVSAIDPD